MLALGGATLGPLTTMPPTAAAETSSSVSTVTRRETIVLFDTAARLDEVAGLWRIPVHAWVYVPQSSRARKAGIAEVFEHAYGLRRTRATQAHFDERINLLLSDNKRGRRVIVSIEGETFALPVTAPNGHAETEIALSRQAVEKAARNGRLSVSAVLPSGDGRHFTGTVHLVPPRGLTVISDIDDTVKVTNVSDKARLWESTFYKPFAAVPGMASLYGRLAAAGASFHYVSSSPWHLYGPLTRFLAEAGFPPATLDLKAIRLKDRSILNILKSPAETKPPQIETLLARFPERDVLLVGDSGEKDPEIYAGVMRRHPQRITRILIRNVTGEKASDARFAAAFAGLDPARWQLFDEPGAIALP